MFGDKPIQSWQCPQWNNPRGNADVFSFLKQNVTNGQQYFENSPAYQQLEESIRILSGNPSPKLAEKQKDDRYSRVHSNRLKRNLREMINSLADVRFTPGYHSDNNQYQNVATVLNRYAAAWYADRFIDIKIKEAIKWMAITTCCYMELEYRRLPGERDKCEIDLIPHSAFEVVMSGVPSSGDLQEAYTVTVIRDVPVYMAHANWPAFESILVPDRETPQGWSDKILHAVKEVFSDEPARLTAKNPTVRLFYQYVIDNSVNTTGKEITMGLDPNDGTPTSWTYTVPYVGQPIPAGYDSQGNQVFRAAMKKDCRMFPGRRLLVATESDMLYDGPMWDWHGKVPLVKMSSDSWPFADYSMIYGVANMQETINEMERMIHQTARNKMNPSILYNMRSTDRNKAKTIRTEITGQRIGFNGAEGNDPVKPLLPDSFYTIPEAHPAFIKYLGEELDYEMGVGAFQALAKMKQGGSAESLDSAMEKAGPVVKGIARDMERAMRDIAEMFKFMVFQYATTPKIMKVVGEDGVTPENFDFDPGKLVPSHLPGEDPNKPSRFTIPQRAHFTADHVKFFITPNTLHQITQMAQKMVYLQLWRGGFPIDPWTLAEIFNIGDFGKKPEHTNSILERWMAWQEMQLEMKARMAEKMQELQGAAGGGEQPNAPGLGPNGGNKGTGGRAPSGQKAPHITPGNGERGPRVRETR